jgi:drug/metabolite transporter (DMT)-like permease
MPMLILAYPVAVYVSLCVLPRERAALGAALAAAALGLVWVMNDPATDRGNAVRFLVLLGAAPVALAALAQALRGVIRPGSPRWMWPALAAGVALTAVFLFFLLA